MIGIRKKDSIGHRHHPKVMRGLSGTMSSMSNYDSPRYVMQRSGVLEDVQESSSGTEEEDSSGSESSSEEEEEKIEVKRDAYDGKEQM